MSSAGDVKPWFREDIVHVLCGLKTAFGAQCLSSPELERGFLMGLYTTGLTFGIDIYKVFTPEEIQFIMQDRSSPIG